jgi:hypothetical protein
MRAFVLSTSRNKTVSTMCCKVSGPAIFPSILVDGRDSIKQHIVVVDMCSFSQPLSLINFLVLAED